MKECTIEDDKKIRISDNFKLKLRKFMDEVAARLDTKHLSWRRRRT